MKVFNTEYFVTFTEDDDTLLYDFPLGTVGIIYKGGNLADFFCSALPYPMHEKLRGVDISALKDASGDPLGGSFSAARAQLLILLNGNAA